jgi:hypothetical protein
MDKAGFYATLISEGKLTFEEHPERNYWVQNSRKPFSL